MRHIRSALIIVLALASPTGFTQQLEEQPVSPEFGGPDSVERQIETDRADKDSFFETRLLEPFDAWQASTEEDYGFTLGMDYSAVTVSASESLAGADDSASSGMYRLYGRWNLTGDGKESSGALVYKWEHRHAYGDDAPSGFYLGQVGYAGLTAPPFSDQGSRFTNLYWRQSLNSGRTVLLGGFLDATDFVDVYGLASPWLHFMNLAFSTGSAAIDLPNDAAMGAAIGHLFDNSWYVIGSLVDRNSDPTDIGEGFDTFFSDNEYFTSIELGHTSTHARIALDNVHLTLWHVDEREEAGAPDGWGANFNWTRYYDRIMPFIRAGYTKDTGSLLEKSLSMGFGYQPFATTSTPGDLIGVGINWGEVNANAFGRGLDDQYTLELFYRWQLTPRFAVTGDLQYLKDPALNPKEDSVFVWALRGRFAL
jgi:porin